MNHNEHQHHGHAPHPSAVGLARDPVCGMDVDPGTAAGSVEHDGRTIYFCSRHCVEKFKADPARYATARAPRVPTASSSWTPPVPANRPAPAGTRYTCPMHPEIVRDRPGACPICGMALEPMTVTADDEADPELVDMTRRFWICLALTVPLLLLSMGEMIPGLGLASLLGGPDPGLGPARPGDARWSSGAAGRSSSAPGSRS